MATDLKKKKKRKTRGGKTRFARNLKRSILSLSLSAYLRNRQILQQQRDFRGGERRLWFIALLFRSVLLYLRGWWMGTDGTSTRSQKFQGFLELLRAIPVKLLNRLNGLFHEPPLHVLPEHRERA